MQRDVLCKKRLPKKIWHQFTERRPLRSKKKKVNSALKLFMATVEILEVALHQRLAPATTSKAKINLRDRKLLGSV